MVVALGLTKTRSAYLGFVAACVVLVALRRPRLLLWSPVVLVLVLSFVPPTVFTRMYSIFDPDNDTNLARYYLWKGGVRMIADYPFLGVGPRMVKPVYMGTLPEARPEVPYRDPATPTDSDAHLHNNILQVTAERGIPALGAWLAMFGVMSLAALRGGGAIHDRPRSRPPSWQWWRSMSRGCSSTTSVTARSSP